MKIRRQIGLILIAALATAIISMLAANRSGAAAATEGSQHAFYRTVKVDGLSIFYREAGPKDAPTILLLHGLIGTREFRTDRARLFFTEQHGENNLFEVFPRD